jgi:sirohydrochlorin cobaltochelatase
LNSVIPFNNRAQQFFKELKMRIVATFTVVLMAVIAQMAPVIAATAGEKADDRAAILVVVFGTTSKEGAKAFDSINEAITKSFPKTEIRWAYTSKIVRNKLAKEGKHFDPPATAIAKLVDEGFNNIVVGSFHTMPGEEFHDLGRDVTALRTASASAGKKILISMPLFSSRNNMEKVAKSILDELSKSRSPEDAVLLMGHGNGKHPGDAVYAAFAYYIQEMDPNVFMATVEGNPTFRDAIAKLKQRKKRKVMLVPLMAVAGDHARNDMCGDGSESWKSQLEKEGFKVNCWMKGMAENSDILKVWIDNIKSELDHKSD